MKMNILITSVGRRVELVQALKKAKTQLQLDVSIIGADLTFDAPALIFCDEKLQVCRIDDPNYIPSLLEICQTKKIDCLIPTIDTDLLLLAEHKKNFEKQGTKVLIADYQKVKLCRDKNLTADYFMSVGLKSPKPVNDFNTYTGGYPAFIKPKDGSSSINAYKVNDFEQLTTYAHQIKDYVIQPFIDGDEYTIDIFCDYAGNPIYITPRQRLAVRAGEVLKTKIVQDKKMIQEIHQLIADFKPAGAITVQLIQDKITKENYYIEINPRFGGGAPLSMKAGANSAKALLEMLNGQKLTYQPYAAKNKAIYCRFDQSVCVNEDEI